MRISSICLELKFDLPIDLTRPSLTSFSMPTQVPMERLVEDVVFMSLEIDRPLYQEGAVHVTEADTEGSDLEVPRPSMGIRWPLFHCSEEGCCLLSMFNFIVSSELSVLLQ